MNTRDDMQRPGRESRDGEARDPIVAMGGPQESFEPLAFEEFARLSSAGRPVALVSIVRATGSAPRGMGAVMAVRQDGSIAGTVGGGAIEHAAIEQALAAMRDGCPRLLHYDFSGGPRRNLEMGCAGTADVYVQPSPARPQLLICGAGHIATALAPLAVDTGFLVTVIDNRPGFPQQERFPEHTRLLHGPYTELLAQQDFDDDATYVVIVTHGHANDEEVLSACLERPSRYLGMIGSRSKVQQVFDHIGTSEAARAALERVRAPIGLDLGGRSPAEIAVAILAEILAVRHDRETIVPMSAHRQQ